MQLALAPRPDAARHAREGVAALACGDPGLAADLRLLTSELVSNSVRHSAARATDLIEVRAERRRACVHVEVSDPGRNGDPEIRDVDPRETGGGMGLKIVREVAAAWGVERTSAGMRAWFELAR